MKKVLELGDTAANLNPVKVELVAVARKKRRNYTRS